MSNKVELNDDELMNISGGMEYTNNFGDCKTYYAGATASSNFTFAFSADHVREYEDLADSLFKPGMSKAEYDALVLAELAKKSWATPVNVAKNSLTPVF